MTTATADPYTPQLENTASKRVYLATRRGMILAGTDPETALNTATDIATRVDDAYQDRKYAFRFHYSEDRINRADLVHTFRCDLRWNDTEPARWVLDYIENDVGTRFPEPTIHQRYFPTTISVWDKLENRWSCYGCGAWVSGDGISPLATHWCHCGNIVVP